MSERAKGWLTAFTFSTGAWLLLIHATSFAVSL